MRTALALLLSALFALPAVADATRLTVLAHRGLPTPYDRTGIDNETCTATRIGPFEWLVVENTLKSMEAAFDFGADVVEFDIHPTTDDEFVVFHDWSLECRTNGQGVTRKQSLAYLRSLDVGYGYTSDGKDFPLRGQGHAMPTWAEVMNAFPGRRFLVNVKSNDPSEGRKILEYVARHDIDLKRLMFYGGDRPIDVLRERLPGVRTTSKSRMRDCLFGHVALGWSGFIPDACRDAVIFVPLNYQGLVWGWPQDFLARMAAVNAEVFAIGPYDSKERGGMAGIDDRAALEKLAPGFAGGIMTDRVDVIGPALGRNPRATPPRRSTGASSP